MKHKNVTCRLINVKKTPRKTINEISFLSGQHTIGINPSIIYLRIFVRKDNE